MEQHPEIVQVTKQIREYLQLRGWNVEQMEMITIRPRSERLHPHHYEFVIGFYGQPQDNSTL